MIQYRWSMEVDHLLESHPLQEEEHNQMQATPQTKASNARTCKHVQHQLQMAQLQRSKSDIGPRGEDQESLADDDIPDWGARHGFEDHYASEEYVSQLANVSRSFLSSEFP
jgi:hypothetical protein